ncbi:hypothetical protein [Actinomyces ruminis]|uniref:hypothetical protein n=1 Tax=Actinomyces ruminis TaxID=1937003 RepID=UPI00211EE2C0|nr:hypothetical protein [Actinomyces ruminis]
MTAAAALIRDCGALAAHEDEIAAHTATGLAALEAAPQALTERSRHTLQGLAELLTARRS